MKEKYQLPIDLSQIDGETLRDLEELYRIDLMAQAMTEEALLPSLGKSHETDCRSVEGFGSCELRVPTMAAMTATLSGETFEDPGFRKFIGKRYPETKVRSKGTKLMVGWEPTEKRFTKQYVTSVTATAPGGAGRNQEKETQ